MLRTVTCLGVCALLVACGPDTSGRAPGRHDLSGVDGGDINDGDDLAVALPDLANTNQADLAGGGGTCIPPAVPKTCAGPIDPKAGCIAQEDCGDGGTGNSLDDDCNGMVDDGCKCTPGDVEPCFAGPPGKRNIGACTDGTQTCGGAGEFVQWGDCRGSIAPGAETCDKLDNDCNGCADDGLCCASVLDCPGPGDPRTPPVAPFNNVALKGELFYPTSANSWKWTVEGGPCDQLFKTTTTPPQQSFTLMNANGIDATVHFTLSGDYTITLTIVDTNGMTQTCKWVQHVIAPGVRFELCWDHTGPSTKGGANLDLHVHRSGSTKDWFDSNDDCFYANCRGSSYSVNWMYGGSNLANCSGSPNGAQWTTKGSCGNPRLDLDNVQDIGKPENSNIDDPNDGDTFRSLVHYYGQDNGATKNKVEEHPIVNVYCGGTLKATYGQAPNTLGPCTAGSTTCFDHGPGAQRQGLMWRVADVTAHVSGGNTTDCTITAIHPPDMGSGYLVTDGVDTY